jgi:Zn-dependent peptidase ImmA (M78 family)
MSKEKINDEALVLLADYQKIRGCDVEPPIPVENIIEQHLNVKIGFVDFGNKLGMRGVLGATYVQERMICVNEKLLDDRSEGRLSFTWAHEAGHWTLHRHLIKPIAGQRSVDKTIFCRSKNAALPIEWQADYFASCILMPEENVRNAFNETFGSNPLNLLNIKSCYKGPLCFDPCVENWPLIADTVRSAGNFYNVSKQAIIVRLQHLGLLINRTGARLTWN